jgi:hypothetical protein
MASHSEHVADVATGVSWGGLAFSHLAQVDEIVRFFSLVISCVSGLIAIAYYWNRLRRL